MRLVALGLPGAFLLEVEPAEDERGLFARTFCARELGATGIDTRIVQTSLSWNPRRGTLRGLHWQAPPHGETKIVRCTRGRIYDVVLDLREASHTWRQHLGIELSADARNALVIPPGVAHGFLTLEDGCEVHYQMSAFHEPAAARGVRYDDPAFGIVWPGTVEVVSARDRAWPDYLRAV
jgi:dTDP-4-dehydrorhamnose 3,5-epimerase